MTTEPTTTIQIHRLTRRIRSLGYSILVEPSGADPILDTDAHTVTIGALAEMRPEVRARLARGLVTVVDGLLADPALTPDAASCQFCRRTARETTLRPIFGVDGEWECDCVGTWAPSNTDRVMAPAEVPTAVRDALAALGATAKLRPTQSDQIKAIAKTVTAGTPDWAVDAAADARELQAEISQRGGTWTFLALFGADGVEVPAKFVGPGHWEHDGERVDLTGLTVGEVEAPAYATWEGTCSITAHAVVRRSGPTVRVITTHLQRHQEETTANPMMSVAVRDRSKEPKWGHGPVRPVIRVITIPATCPQCGGPRGTPRGLNQYEDGESYWVEVWKNPCGHVDMYDDVIREAANL
jgi:hypothetical protein